MTVFGMSKVRCVVAISLLFALRVITCPTQGCYRMSRLLFVLFRVGAGAFFLTSLRVRDASALRAVQLLPRR